MKDKDLMQIALDEARKSAEEGEVPVGAVAVYQDQIVAATHNEQIRRCDPTAHAEILALRVAATHLGVYRLEGLDVFVTLEPCMMCFGAMIHARVRRLVYGAEDPKVGFSKILKTLADDAVFNHVIETSGGVLAEESSQILQDFFKLRR